MFILFTLLFNCNIWVHCSECETLCINPLIIFLDEENKFPANYFKFYSFEILFMNSGHFSYFPVYRAGEAGCNQGGKFGKLAQVWIEVLKLQLL